MKKHPNETLANHLEVVHSLPGRLRLRLVEADSSESLTEDDVKRKEYLGEIAQYLRQQEGVESVQVRHITSSIVVTFNPHILSTSQLQEILDPFPLSSAKLEGATLQSSGKKVFSQLVSLIPILLSWLVVKRFNLSGLKAIATYLLVTGLMGEAIEQLKDQFFPSLKDEHNTEKKAQFKKLLSLKHNNELDYEIIHHIPGRIRLSIPKLRQNKHYAQKLEDLLTQDARLTQVRINPNTGSMVVYYLPEAFSDLREEKLDLILSNWFESRHIHASLTEQY
jgi:hypothetical protein